MNRSTDNTIARIAVIEKMARALCHETSMLAGDEDAWRNHIVEAEAALEASGLLSTAQQTEELREALTPFADLLGEDDDDFADDTQVVVKFGRSTNYGITLGDIRKAAALK